MQGTDRDQINASRRDFLGSVAVLGGTAAVVAVGARAMTQDDARAADASLPESVPKRSYQLTAHIQTYYEKAGF